LNDALNELGVIRSQNGSYFLTPIKLKINPEYEALLPKATPEEYEALKKAIATTKQDIPIIVNSDYVILDGHHRNRACLELGKLPRFMVMQFENKLLEKKFVIETNLVRRQLNDYQRAVVLKPLLEIEKELAKQRQAKAGEHFGRGKENSLGSNETKLSKGRAIDIVAKKGPLSPSTFQRALVVMEKATEELKKKVENGEISIAKAYNTVKPPTAATEETPALTLEMEAIQAQYSKEEKTQQSKDKSILNSLKTTYPELLLKKLAEAYPTLENGALTKDKLAALAARATAIEDSIIDEHDEWETVLQRLKEES
jgi:ParB-like chromosome segregation protein Spo0J